jgi:excisionase family DNA binding protein
MPKEILGLKLYTVSEVAKLLERSPSTIRNYIYEGKLDAVSIGRDYLIPENSLKEFLIKNSNNPQKLRFLFAGN